MWAEHGGQRLRGGIYLALVAVFETDVDEARKRRIAETLALLRFMLIECLVVIINDLADNGLFGLACLQHHQAAALPPPGPPGHLREHLERAFGSAEVRPCQRLVGIDDAYHPHAVKIEPFGNHLRADEYVSLAALKAADDLVVGGAGAGGVKVKARRAGLGQEGMYGLFNLFRAVTQVAQVRIAAVGAAFGHIVRRTAGHTACSAAPSRTCDTQ